MTPRMMCCCVVIGLIGCSSAPTEPGGDASDTSRRPALPDVGTLPDLTDPFPQALDGGRLQIREPHGWTRQSRSARYLMAWLEQPTQRMPQLSVRAEDSDRDTTTSANVESQRKELAEETGGEVAVAEMAGQPAFYVRKRTRSERGVRLMEERLFTFRDGRRYDVVMLLDPGTEGQYRRYLFGVAQGLEFVQPTAEDASDAPNDVPEVDLDALDLGQ